MTTNELILIAIIEANTREMAALYLQDYIQRNGPVSNEAGDEIKRLLELK